MEGSEIEIEPFIVTALIVENLARQQILDRNLLPYIHNSLIGRPFNSSLPLKAGIRIPP
jgi:hypothetical protein